MNARRVPTWVVAVVTAFHLLGIVRSNLPAQDGLKFLRVARQFHRDPWLDVVRGSDQHPLYPACIAVAEPAVALVMGHGPDTWRLTGQLVSALASILLLFPLFALAFALFRDRSAAAMAALLWGLLPLPLAVGHDTLSDPLALLGVATSLWLGEKALRTGRLGPALGCGLTAGLGYLSRPEVAIVPAAVLVVGGARYIVGWLQRRTATLTSIDSSLSPARPPSIRMHPLSSLLVGFLAIIGLYALAKGELSEKIAARIQMGMTIKRENVRKVPHPLPDGLKEAPWNFDPKEETGRTSRLTPLAAAIAAGNGWVQGMGWAFAVFAGWGAVRVRSGPGKWLIGVYAVLFLAVLIRHASALGYISERHELSLVLVALPWCGAGVLLCGRRLASLARYDESRTRWLGGIALIAILAFALGVQFWKPGHPSRWGHGAAGRWLVEHAQPGDKVLDTRGWARFVSGLPGYDYWHVRQAFTDDHLAYFVVTSDELAAPSLRAKTLNAVLDYAAEPVASFPGRKEGQKAEVLVYRYHYPTTWAGLRP